MKISIELEIQPDEVQLATELLATLRLLTEHVKASPPSVTNIQQILEQLVMKLGDEHNLDKVAEDISAVLRNSAFGSAEELSTKLLDAFDTVVLVNLDLVLRQQSVVPYIHLLPKLPEPFKTNMRDGLINKVLQHLTKKRAVNTERTQFFAHAEAFAVLVNIEFVSVDGAAMTVQKLLGKPETRSAAITMLGKTVELCCDKLLTKCSPVNLNNLWRALEGVTEEIFKYDIDWITQHVKLMASPGQGTTAGAAAGAGAVSLGYTQAAGASPRGLTAISAFVGHSKTIFTLCYDAAHKQLISGGKDSCIMVWGKGGEAVHRIDMPTHFVCSMDIHTRHGLLLLCAVATEANPTPPPPCIAVYDTNRNWQNRGMLSKPQCNLVSCIRCLAPEVDGFVTGETLQNGELQELVCYYDLSRVAGGGPGGGLAGLTPVRSYREHENLVTCVARCGGDPNTFVSGSRDKSIRVWDRRVDKSVGVFGLPDASGFAVHAHEDMITCLDSAGDMLLSTGLDGYLAFWDFRALGMGPGGACGPLTRMQLDGQPMLKVAAAGLASTPCLAAVSTFQSLYLVDYSSLAAPVSVPATVLSNGRPLKHYHDIRWAPEQQVLYAGGEGLTIDVFQLTW